MQVKYRSANGQFEVNFDVKTQTELFQEIASFQEVFESSAEETIKGKKVPAGDVQFRVRDVDDNKYFEKVYVGSDKELWGYKLPFGQNKKGGSLFPKRFLDDEDRTKNEDGGNGWRKWKKQAGESKSAKETAVAAGGAKKDDVPF